MEKINTLPIISDRFTIDDIDSDLISSYGNDQFSIITQGIDTATDKKDLYRILLSNFTSFNTSGRKPIHLWVNIKHSHFMVIHATAIGNGFLYQLVAKSYSGNLHMEYGSTEEETRQNSISQDIYTVVCRLEDINFIQIGSYKITEYTNRQLYNYPLQYNSLEEVILDYEQSLNTLYYNARYRSYLKKFKDFYNELGKYDITKLQTNYNGKYNLLNIYDSIWKQYRDMIYSFFPPNFQKDSPIIPATLLMIYESEIEHNSKSERMFTIKEMNELLKVIGLDPIQETITEPDTPSNPTQEIIDNKLYVDGKEVPNPVYPKTKSELQQILRSDVPGYQDGSVESLPDLSYIYTGDITDFSYLFYSLEQLKDTDGIRSWNTKSVTNISYLFYECSNLINISGIEYWDTSKVTRSHYIFAYCTNLSNISPLLNWVTSSFQMLHFGFNFTNINDLSSLYKWNTNSVTNISGLFRDCSSLTIEGMEKLITEWNKTSSNGYISSITPELLVS